MALFQTKNIQCPQSTSKETRPTIRTQALVNCSPAKTTGPSWVKTMKLLALFGQIEQALEMVEAFLRNGNSETEALYEKGLCYHFSGQYETAIAYFEQVLNIQPEHEKAISQLYQTTLHRDTLELGDYLLSMGRWQDAISKYKNILKIIIDIGIFHLAARVHCKIAEIYLQQHLVITAIKEYTNALQIDNYCVEALRERVKCYTQIDSYESANQDNETMFRIVECELFKLSEGAEYITPLYNSIMKVKEKEIYRKKIYQAETLVQNGITEELEQALSLAEECLQFCSSDIKALCVKGLCLYHKDQYQEALEQFKQVLVLEPFHSLALNQTKKIQWFKSTIERGSDAFDSCRWQDALDNFSEALKIDEDNKSLNAKLYCKKAKIYLQYNAIELAIIQYDYALEIDSNCVEALRERAICYTKMETIAKSEEVQQSVRNSIVNLEEIENYRKKCDQAEILLQSQTTDKLEQALHIAEECLKNVGVNPFTQRALCVKGLCLYYKDQYQQALDQFAQVLHLEPSHSMALNQTKKIQWLKSAIDKGTEAFDNCRWQDALDNFNEALNIDKDNTNLNAKLYCKKANIYLQQNIIYSAIIEYTYALTVDYNCLEALRGRASCYTRIESYEYAIEDYQRMERIVKSEEVKKSARISIISLKRKESYRKKCHQAEILVQSQTTEKLEQAMNIAEECLQFYKFDINALCVKALCLYYKDQYQQAIEQFEQVLLFNPMHSTALKITKDIILLESLIKKGNEAFESCRWQEALDSYSKALSIAYYNRSLNVKLHCKKADIYLKLNKIYYAINEYTNALKCENNCVEALRERAVWYTKIKSYECAIDDYERLARIVENEQIKLLARNSIININIIYLKEKETYRKKCDQAETLVQSRTTEELNQALNLADECLQFCSTDTKALCVKGLCMYHKGQYQQAIDQFKQVLRLDPSHSIALNESKKIQWLKSTIEKGSDAFDKCCWQEALDIYNMALNIDENNESLNIKLYFKRAEIYSKLNQINQAINEYTHILLLDNNCVKALRERAKCYNAVGKPEDALKDYEKLYTIDKSEDTKASLHKTKTEYNVVSAEEKVIAGNNLYRRHHFKNALVMYKEAIDLCPEKAEYYINTFSCYMKLSMLKEAFDDAGNAVALYVKSSDVIRGIAKCYIALGDLFGAERAIIKANDAGKDCKEDQDLLSTLRRLDARAKKYIDERTYGSAISCIDQCLEISPFNYKVKLLKAECLAMIGKIDQALEIADECLRSDQSDPDSIFIKGLCIYYNEKFEQALKYFKEVQYLSPDHGKASAIYKKAKLLQQKKEKGNEEFKMLRWQEALVLYKEALTIDDTHVKVNAKLHFNMAAAYSKLNQTQAAAEACTEALELDGNYVKALTLRAKCYTELEEHDCAVNDYEQLNRINPSDKIKKLLDEAKQSLKEQARCKDYYKILGVNRTASKDDILKAYKRLALVHHPDKHSDSSTYERNRQTRRFQQISEAYNVLSNENLRSTYDAKDSFE